MEYVQGTISPRLVSKLSLTLAWVRESDYGII